MQELNEKSVDLITKFFDIFQQLSVEDQKKALLVVEGMSISKGCTPISAGKVGGTPAAPVQRRDAGARSPQRVEASDNE